MDGDFMTYVKNNASKVPVAIQNAIACADAAYFEYTCAQNDKALGHYMDHCLSYPPLASKPSIFQRFDNTSRMGSDVQTSVRWDEIQQALDNILNQAPSECNAWVAQTKARYPSEFVHGKALLPLYFGAMNLLSSGTCNPEESRTYEAWLRTKFDNDQKPVFGMEDIGDYCSELSSQTLEQDGKLATWLMDRYGTVNLTKQSLERMAAAQFFCRGHFGMGPDFDPPRTKKGSALMEIVSKIANKHVNKTVLVTIPWDKEDVISLQGYVAGFTIEAMDTSTDIKCLASTAEAKGPAQLGLCLSPPFREQPASCLSFTKAFAQQMKDASDNTTTSTRVGKRNLYGRTRNDTGCQECISQKGSCSCEVGWSNSKDFVDLCTKAPIDGISGHVLEMDLTRNPCSTKEDIKYSEKSINGITQECYATTCETDYLETMALRSWYKKVKGVPAGQVNLRPIGSQGGPKCAGDKIETDDKAVGQSTVVWILLSVLGVALVLFLCVFVAHYMRGGTEKPAKKKRSARKAEQTAEVEEGMTETTPSLTQVTPQLQAPAFQLVSQPPNFAPAIPLAPQVQYITAPGAVAPVQSVSYAAPGSASYAQPVVAVAPSVMRSPLQVPLTGYAAVPGKR
jgi:hypothetical protein